MTLRRVNTFEGPLDLWGDVQEEVSLLEGELRAADAAEARGLRHYELARWLMALDRLGEADRHLLECSRLLPRFRSAPRAARQIARLRGDSEQVAHFLRAEEVLVERADVRAALARLRARVHLYRQADTSAAVDALVQASAQPAGEGSDQTYLLQLLIAGAQDNRDLAIEAIEQLALVQPQYAGLLLGAQVLLTMSSGIEATARKLWRSLDQDSPASLKAIAPVVFRLAGPARASHAAVAHELLAEDASAKHAAVHRLEAGLIYAEDLGNPQRAMELLGSALDDDAHSSIAAELFQVARAARAPEVAFDAATRWYGLSASNELRARAAYWAGQIAGNELADLDQAVRWYRRCLDIVPGYQPAFEGIARAYESHNAYAELLELHRSAVEGAGSAEARALNAYRLAELLLANGRTEDGIIALNQALTHNPQLRPATALLERQLTQDGRYAELVELRERQLAVESDGERVRYLLAANAQTWRDQLNHLERAWSCYQRLLDVDPDELSAIRSAAQLCHNAGRWEQLLELTEREIALIVDPQRKAELFYSCGTIALEKRFDETAAERYWVAALGCRADFLPALQALGRVYRRQQRWSELIEMHRAEAVMAADEAHSLALTLRVAEVARRELRDPKLSAEHLERALTQARQDAGLTALLLELRRRNGEQEAAAEMLRHEADAVTDDQARTACMIEAGLAVAPAQGNPLQTDATASALAKALRRSSRPGSALWFVYAAGGTTDRFDVDTLVERILRQPHDNARLWRGVLIDLRIRSQSRAAEHLRQLCENTEACLADLAGYARQCLDERLHAERHDVLGRISAAVADDPFWHQFYRFRAARVGYVHSVGAADASYRALDSADNEHALVSRICERELRAGGKTIQLAELLARRARHTRGNSAAALWHEVGDLLAQASKHAAAKVAWARALELVPEHVAARVSLVNLYVSEGEFEVAAALLEVGAKLAVAPVTRRQLRLGLIRLCEGKLDDSERVIQTCRTLLQEYPADALAYRKLRDHLSKAGRWEEIARAAERFNEHTDELRVQVELYEELAAIYLDHLGRPEDGARALERLIALEPNRRNAVERLAELRMEHKRYAQARTLFLRLARPEVALEQRLLAWRRLGEIEFALGRAEQALEFFMRAGAGDRADVELLRRIAQSAAAAGDVPVQIDALVEVGRRSQDTLERGEALKTAATLTAERLGEVERAIDYFHRALVLNPTDLEAIERLVALYLRKGEREAAEEQMQVAIAHYRARIAQDAPQGWLFAGLTRLFRWRRAWDGFYCAGSVAQLWGEEIGHADKLADYALNCRDTLDTALAEPLYQAHVLGPWARSPMRQFLHTWGELLMAGASQGPEALGLSRRSRMSTKDPRFAMLQQWVSVFCGRDVDVWIGKTPEQQLVEHFGRPTLVLGESVVEGLGSPRFKFSLGRTIIQLGEGSGLLARIADENQWNALLDAALSASEGKPATPQAQAIAKRMSRRQRKPLAEAIASLRAEGPIELAAARRALDAAGDRTGLLLACDVSAGLHAARTLRPAKTFSALCAYVVSPAFLELRQALRLTPSKEQVPDGR